MIVIFRSNEKLTLVQMSKGVISLENSRIEFLVREHEDELKQVPEVELELELGKEFRYKHYPLVLLLLKNTLKEFISTQAPQPDRGLFSF